MSFTSVERSSREGGPVSKKGQVDTSILGMKVTNKKGGESTRLHAPYAVVPKQAPHGLLFEAVHYVTFVVLF